MRHPCRVAGGGESMYQSATCWDSVEVYSHEREAWALAPAMHHRRSALAVAVGYRTNHVYCVGGYAGHGRYLDSAERIDASGSGGAARWEVRQTAGRVAAAAPRSRAAAVRQTRAARGPARVLLLGWCGCVVSSLLGCLVGYLLG